MRLRVGTFNLFQFVKPPFSWYTKKEKFTIEEWEQKISWIKKEILAMNCDVIGFQEVFSKEALKELVNELGFSYFETVDNARVDSKNPNVYTSTTVAIASKYKILELQDVKIKPNILKKFGFEKNFFFARKPIKALIEINNQNILCYVCHLKSNRENEFEYIFTKDTTLEEKINKVDVALKSNYSLSLKQRLCEASLLFEDIKQNIATPTFLMADLNDRLHSITIEALSNKRFHYSSFDKDSYILIDAYNLYEKKIYNPHPEQKEIKRTPTSYFIGKGNVLDYVFVSNHFNKKSKFAIAQVTSYEIFDEHLQKNNDGSLLNSDHAQVVCEVAFN